MKEKEIDCLKSENKRLKKQIKELKEKQKTSLVLGMEIGVLICQIITIIAIIITRCL